MWEMEGRTTEEIATALNTTPANVRHILVRARKSMVRVLEEWIVDEKTGLTALNALSTTYKKTVEMAQKSSKAALSLLLVITAFLGFNSMTGNESPLLPVVAQFETESSPMSPTAPTAEATAPTAEATATAKAAATAAAKKAQLAAVNAKIAPLSFVGLDNKGIPTGFSVTDENGVLGKARLTKGISTLGTSGMLINNQLITGSVGPNVLIDQLITIDGFGTNYDINNINIGFGGLWRSVEINSVVSSIERLANGQHLITATANIGYLKPTNFSIPTGARGYDLADAPASITTRVLLNSGKTTILAQAVQVIDK
jgi:hypothetical protein